MTNQRFAVYFVLLAWLLLPLAHGAQLQRLLYYVPDDDAWRSLSANARKISIIGPAAFTVNSKGEVTGAVEDRVRLLAERNKIRLMPLLVNEKFDPQVAHDILSDASLRKQVVSDAVRLCQKSGCWGLQLDFEQVPPEDSKNLVLFVSEAFEAFHKQRLQFTVAIPALLLGEKRPLADSERGFGGFPIAPGAYDDLKELSLHADFVSLMAYDHYSKETAPGPIAGYVWVEQNIRYFLNQIPQKKLFLGLGLYARQWCNQDVTESSYRAAVELSRKSGVVIQWDAMHRSPWFEFEKTECRDVVWLENQKSLREKLNLLQKYRLAGFSAWRLGQEDQGFWKELH